MKIFVINLEKDKDRLDYMANSLSQFNFKNWERIDAVYGKYLPDLEKYGKILNPSQIGCYLSHLKTYQKIVDQNLDYGVILEDDVTLTEWFPKLEEILQSVPKDFDVIWVGNCQGKWPRNPCNIIPDYDYDFLEHRKIGDYVYEITKDCLETDNYPIGCYGVVVSRSFAEKFLSIPFKDHFKRPIDNFLVENNSLKRYMTVPSIIIHCYEFGSNIDETSNHPDLKDKINPYENIWLKYPKQETDALELLENIGILLDKHNITYSLMYGTMLGYGRNQKLISYDDDIDIIINKKDIKIFEDLVIFSNISNIYKFETPILNGTLYYKLYPKYNTINIDKYEYKWPFIDIFIYDLDEKGNMIIDSNKKLNVPDQTIPVSIMSYNGNKKYNFKIFKDYEKILDESYKNWRNICMSSDWNHIKEEATKVKVSFNCKNIIPGYVPEDDNHHYSLEIKKSFKVIYITLFISLLLTILAYHFKKYRKMILFYGFTPLFLFMLFYIRRM